MNLTKQEIIDILDSDGQYYNNFTEDAAKDYFHTEHRRLTKIELTKLLNENLEKSEWMRKEKERIIKQKEEEKREAKA